MDKKVTCAQIENAIMDACDYITSIELFDIYEGIQLGLDKKSMAFSVVFTPKDEEFKPEVVDGFVENILECVETKYGAVLRA